MNKRIIIYSIFALSFILVMEAVFGISYIPKQILRMVMFLGFPLVGIYYLRKSNLHDEIKFEKPTSKELLFAFIVGIIIFLGTFFGYYFLRFMFHAQGTIDGLQSIGVTIENVYAWGLYLTFVNSLLEEFFFRGYIFYSLEKQSYKKAIIVSSLLFSLYHSVLMILMFEWYTVIFTLVGLFIIGMLLAYVNKFGKSFINSWIVHIFADIGCITVLVYMYSIV